MDKFEQSLKEKQRQFLLNSHQRKIIKIQKGLKGNPNFIQNINGTEYNIQHPPQIQQQQENKKQSQASSLHSSFNLEKTPTQNSNTTSNNIVNLKLTNQELQQLKNEQKEQLRQKQLELEQEKLKKEEKQYKIDLGNEAFEDFVNGRITIQEYMQFCNFPYMYRPREDSKLNGKHHMKVQFKESQTKNKQQSSKSLNRILNRQASKIAQLRSGKSMIFSDSDFSPLKSPLKKPKQPSTESSPLRKNTNLTSIIQQTDCTEQQSPEKSSQIQLQQVPKTGKNDKKNLFLVKRDKKKINNYVQKYKSENIKDKNNNTSTNISKHININIIKSDKTMIRQMSQSCSPVKPNTQKQKLNNSQKTTPSNKNYLSNLQLFQAKKLSQISGKQSFLSNINLGNTVQTSIQNMSFSKKSEEVIQQYQLQQQYLQNKLKKNVSEPKSELTLNNPKQKQRKFMKKVASEQQLCTLSPCSNSGLVSRGSKLRNSVNFEIDKIENQFRNNNNISSSNFNKDSCINSQLLFDSTDRNQISTSTQSGENTMRKVQSQKQIPVLEKLLPTEFLSRYGNMVEQKEQKKQQQQQVKLNLSRQYQEIKHIITNIQKQE